MSLSIKQMRVITWVITMLLIAFLFLACNNTKEIVKTEYQTETIIDSAYKSAYDSIIAAHSKEVFRFREQIKTLNNRVATLSQGSAGDKDTSLPVKNFKVQSGKSYFKMQGQWVAFDYTFYVDSCVSKNTSVLDTSSVETIFLRSRVMSLSLENKSLTEQVSRLEKSKKKVIYKTNWKWIFILLGVIALLVSFIAFRSKIKTLLPWL